MFAKSAILVPLAAVVAKAQIGGQGGDPTAISRAQIALNTLQQWYDASDGLWNTMGWWNGANALTMIGDLAREDFTIMSTAEYVFNNTYVVAPTVNPAPGVQKVSNEWGETTIYYPPNWPHSPNWHHAQQENTVNASLWLDGYYDDDSWWALAWISAYDATGRPEYLQLAQGIFEALVSLSLAFNFSFSNEGGILVVAADVSA